MPDYLIAPSILSGNFARLGEEVELLPGAGDDMVVAAGRKAADYGGADEPPVAGNEDPVVLGNHDGLLTG